jgi:hypothetical protein
MIEVTRYVGASLAWASLVLGGCGGGGDMADIAQPAMASSTQANAASVRLEGCVIDALWLGAPGTAVHARSADGRTLTTAMTDARGVFVMTVPARSAIVLDTDFAGGGEVSLNTADTSLSVGGCLRREQ